MKTFQNICAQGDVLFIRRDAIPATASAAKPESGQVIVTHSETGHHHCMVLDRELDEPNVEMFSDNDNPLLAWLKINRPTALEHRREFDTHEPIMFEPGIYEVRRQREYMPEGWRQVQD
jgi:hypothetical protein